jgi:hypothetical protein
MTVPTTNVSFKDIWEEANGTYSSGIISMLTMSFFSYFAGPNGSNSQTTNNWGQGEGSGGNRIYGTTAKTTNIKVGDFDGLTYFYDQTNFQIRLNLLNNINTPPPPPPPIDNDVTINVLLYDSSFTYLYASGGSPLTSGGGNYNADISQPTTPIIFRAYWKVEVTTAPNFGGGTVTIDINGTNYANSIALTAGPTPNTLDSNTYGTADVAFYGGMGATGLQFDVTCN